MQAIKGNKVYTIDKTCKNDYISQGYDIVENGKVIAYGKGKTVSFDKFKALEQELDKFKKAVAGATDKKALDELKEQYGLNGKEK